MKKQTRKHLGISLNIHPAHFHLGMYVALAMIALTAGKGSGDLLQTVYGHADQHDALETVEMREAETHQQHPSFNSLRIVGNSGA